MKKTDMVILITLFLASMILGCNAIKGAEKDVDKAGKDIKKAIERKN